MPRITIEGTVTPSTFLGRGERTTVDRSPFINKLIRKGFVKEVKDRRPVVDEVVALVEKQQVTAELEAKVTDSAPTRSALKSDWAAWLDRKDIEYAEDATRAEMIALWDATESAEPAPESDG